MPFLTLLRVPVVYNVFIVGCMEYRLMEVVYGEVS